MSASPATVELMCLMRADSAEMALSKARGPSSKPPSICPRWAILHSAAASIVDGMLALTVSTADNTATLGWATPMMRASVMAFCTMSALSVNDGRMLSAASLKYSAL